MCYIQHIVKKKLPYLRVDQKTGNVIDNDESENAIENFIYQAIDGLDRCKRACQKVIKQQVRFNCNGKIDTDNNNNNNNPPSPTERRMPKNLWASFTKFKVSCTKFYGNDRPGK